MISFTITLMMNTIKLVLSHSDSNWLKTICRDVNRI